MCIRDSLTPTLELRRSTRGAKEDRNWGYVLVLASLASMAGLASLASPVNSSSSPGARVTVARWLALRRIRPLSAPRVERRSSSVGVRRHRPARPAAGAIAERPLEQGSPGIVRFLRTIPEARETPGRAERPELDLRATIGFTH